MDETLYKELIKMNLQAKVQQKEYQESIGRLNEIIYAQQEKIKVLNSYRPNTSSVVSDVKHLEPESVIHQFKMQKLEQELEKLKSTRDKGDMVSVETQTEDESEYKMKRIFMQVNDVLQEIADSMKMALDSIDPSIMKNLTDLGVAPKDRLTFMVMAMVHLDHYNSEVIEKTRKLNALLQEKQNDLDSLRSVYQNLLLKATDMEFKLIAKESRLTKTE